MTAPNLFVILSGIATVFGLSAYADSTNLLCLNITRTNNAGFLLDVRNTSPGVFYGVGAKTVLNAEPFNTWSLVSVFEAQSTNEVLVGTASRPVRFYTAVNLDEYAGPSVSIVAPASETISGTASLQVQVKDILPLTTLKVYVGSVQVGVITTGQNGIISVPTYLFADGQHEIWVQAANAGVLVDTDGDSIGDEVVPFNAWASMTLNFTNDVRLENYSPLYSAAGSIMLNYATASPQNYVFEVFNLQGNLLHTASGQSTNGAINGEWNFTDLSGDPVADDGYNFSLTTTPQSGGPAKTTISTSFVDKGVTVGKYVISYGTWPNSGFNNGLASLSHGVSIHVNTATLLYDDKVGTDREAYGSPIHADFSTDPIPIRQATETSDLAVLTNALSVSSVGSWFFDGHSGPNNMIHGADEYLTVDLTPKQVAGILGNSCGYVSTTNVLSYGRRLFSTFITGCGAASGASEYPDATGTPPGVVQVGNPQIKKSAFLGFTGLSYQGSTKFGWIQRIHTEWLDQNDYDTPLATAVNIANTVYPEVVAWGPTLFGYGPLEYNADESR